jgi:AcrR family transcriptional regulator
VKIPSTIRDPKILAQRRAELVEVATNLFLERGYHKTSIREIARACPFNLAAVYMYVSSKEDILYLVAQHLVNEIVKALQPGALTDRDPVDALKFAFETYCQVVHRFSRHIRLLYREIESLQKQARDPIVTSVQSLVAIFEGLVERAIKSGEMRKVDPQLAALDLLVAAHMWALHGRLLRSRFDLDSFTREQSRVLFEGLLSPPGANRSIGKAQSVKPAVRKRVASTAVKPLPHSRNTS